MPDVQCRHSDDLLQKLLDLTDEGGLTHEEMVCLLTNLLAAGYDTTRNQLTFILYLATQHPEHWRRVAAEPEFSGPFIEESLRYLSPIGAVHRVTNFEIVYRDVVIPANTFISLSLNIPGRDPAMNADPDWFNPDRPKPNHLAFGQGEHYCLGHWIARALLKEAVPVLARAMIDPKIDSPPTYHSPMGVWGFRTLPIAFTPGELPKLA